MRTAIWTDFMKITHHYNVHQIITFTACLVPATTLGMEKKKRQNVPVLQLLLSNSHRKDAGTENEYARGRAWRQQELVDSLSLWYFSKDISFEPRLEELAQFYQASKSRKAILGRDREKVGEQKTVYSWILTNYREHQDMKLEVRKQSDHKEPRASL